MEEQEKGDECRLAICEAAGGKTKVLSIVPYDTKYKPFQWTADKDYSDIVLRINDSDGNFASNPPGNVIYKLLVVPATQSAANAGQPLAAPPDKIVLWNTHNNHWNDRGTTACNVQLRRGGNVVWTKNDVKVAWSNTAEPATEILIPNVEFDAVHVDITAWQGWGAGLCEIEVIKGGKNIAAGVPVKASGERGDFKASCVVDGVKNSDIENKGYWWAIDHQPAWIELDLSSTDAAKLTALGESPLTADQQVESVVKKLQQLNPGFDGRVTHKIENGVVTEFGFISNNVADISPLRELTELKSLDCGGTDHRKGLVADLTPLRGMQLKRLYCRETHVADLSPLQGMPLAILSLNGTLVSDLSPLKGMPLTDLLCGGTRISDLSPLAGSPLSGLICPGTQVTDLSPLKGLPLKLLNIRNTKVKDLSPLKGLPLLTLNLDHTQVSDLSPLAGMHLHDICCYETPVTDLSPLSGMAPVKVRFSPQQIAGGIDAVRNLKSLQEISIDPEDRISLTPAAFWDQFDRGDFKPAAAVASTVPAVPLATVNVEGLAPGLLVTEYPRVPQQDVDSMTPPPYESFGPPLGHTKAIGTLSGWPFTPSRNAIAEGYLKVDVPGKYRFVSDNFYDRNALYINDMLICSFRDQNKEYGEVVLPAGYAAIRSIGYFGARGSVKVLWLPPGETEPVPIPSDRLVYDASLKTKREAEIIAGAKQAAAELSPAATVDVGNLQSGLWTLQYKHARDANRR